MMNTKKRKTGKEHLLSLPNFIPTFSQSHIAPKVKRKTLQQSLVGEIILQIVGRAERQADLHELTINYSLRVLERVQNALRNYQQMNKICEEEPQLFDSQAEPIQITPFVRNEDRTAQQLKQSNYHKDKSGSRGMLRHPKEKSQSCDLNDQLKRRQKFIKQSIDLRQSSNKNMITLNFRVRNSEGEDRSTQIQQLLRRKKELLLQQKQPIGRNHTQNSRNVSSDRKQGKYFGQDDEGEAFELVFKKRKNPVALLHAVTLANIRMVPAQQVQQGMKKKPIVELMTKRRPKRRKDIGDTCVLIEQLYDTDICEKIDQQKYIQDLIKPQKGVKLTAKDRSCTQQPTKLPNIR